MKILKNKTATIAITMILIFSMIASIMMAQNVKAGNQSIATFAFINVAPNPVGIGQTVTIGMWLGQPPPTANVQYGDRWQNFKVTITKPDGSTEALGPFTSDDTGGTFVTYTPNQLGNYSFFFSYPGQVLAGTNLSPAASAATKAFVGDYFQPSNASTTFTVQQEQVGSYPNTGLPTNYWQTPVNAENVNQWYTLTGNWLGFGQIFSANTGNYNATSNYNPYTAAPMTSHIMWTLPAASGGVLGGEFGGDTLSNYYATSQYEPKFAPIIMNGVLYYTQYPGTLNNPSGWAAIDLFTGKTLWTIDTPLTLPNTANTASVPTAGAPTVLRCGQLLDYVSPNQYGALTYLWSTGTPTTVAAATAIAAGTTTYNLFDAMTGSYVLSIVNGSAMTLTEDQNGNLIGYYVNATSNTLNEWNSTRAVENYDLITGINTNIWEWRPPQGAIIPFKYGLMWSMPIASNISGAPLPATLSLGAVGADTAGSINSGVVLLTCISPGENFFNAGFQIEAAYDANTGAQLWIVNRTETPFTRVDIAPVSNGVYVEINQDTFAIAGYNVNTDAQLWSKALPNANPYDSIGGFENVVANGVLYLYGFGGDIYAINMADGNIIWQTDTTVLHGDAGTNTPYGVWPLWTFGLGTVADGILYLPEGHEYSPPLFHGAHQLAINTTNGQLVWSILGFDVTNPPAIADGIATTLNAYDNQIYAFGKGPSAITVNAPSIGVTTATAIKITGTVTDIASGSKQEAVAANFPNGLPAVSDASMSSWMEYVYEQQPCPANVTGVPVSISVLDSNGNYRTIGSTISDGSGMFTFTWTPDITGDFTVFANFAGSGSYYPSGAETSFTASTPAATASPNPTVSLASTQTTIMGVGIAIIVVVIVGFALLFLALRKRA